MIKCKCFECNEETVFESHKDAYMAGWDWSRSGKCFCDKCSEKPADVSTTDGESDE